MHLVYLAIHHTRLEFMPTLVAQTIIKGYNPWVNSGQKIAMDYST